MDDLFDASHLRHAQARAPGNAPPHIARSAALKTTPPAHPYATGRVRADYYPGQGMVGELVVAGRYPEHPAVDIQKVRYHQRPRLD